MDDKMLSDAAKVLWEIAVKLSSGFNIPKCVLRKHAAPQRRVDSFTF